MVAAGEASILLLPERGQASATEELAMTPRYRLVGRVVSLGDVPDAVRRHRPDVLVAEVSTAERLREATIVLDGVAAKWIAVSSLPAEVALLTSLAAGARGFVRKPFEPGTLERAVAVVVAGHAFVDPRSTAWLVELAVRGHLSRPGDGLTLRQAQVVELVRGGLNNREIARVLDVSLATVKSHLHAAMRRLGATDRWAATVLSDRLRDGDS